MEGMRLKVKSVANGSEETPGTIDYWCTDESGKSHLLNLFTDTDHDLLPSDAKLVGKTIECDGISGSYAKNVRIVELPLPPRE